MLITIEFMSALKRAGIPQKKRYSFSEPITLNHLLDFFEFSTSERNFLIILVNGKKKSLDYSIKNGDKIFITIPIGGG
jgi:hypothetical protein